LIYFSYETSNALSPASQYQPRNFQSWEGVTLTLPVDLGRYLKFIFFSLQQNLLKVRRKVKLKLFSWLMKKMLYKNN